MKRREENDVVDESIDGRECGMERCGGDGEERYDGTGEVSIQYCKF